jgi:predicted nucleotidyltransferase
MNPGGTHLKVSEKETLDDLKKALESSLGKKLISLALFGSKARGDFERDSDLDVAIVVKGLTRELKRAILDEVADVELRHLQPVSTLVLSAEDFEDLKRRERRLALDIETEGIRL